MAVYCLEASVADALLKAVKEDSVIGDVAKLYEMTTAQRREAFGKYVPEATAEFINGAFEKAMVSNRKTALADWAKKTFSSESKKNGNYKTTLDKIAELDEAGILTPENQDAFLGDLVRDKLGVSISADEAKVISEKAKKIEELAKKPSELGLPSVEYFRAKREMEKYLLSQMPAHNLKVASSIIGRGMMLASVKSPTLNIESNTVQGVLTAFERRISRNSYTGLNSDFANKYIRENMAIFQASDYDLSRMTSLKDDRKILGEEIVHSEGSGPVRWAGRVVEDTIFKQLMGAPDVAFSSVHFADSVNLATTKLAYAEGLKGPEAKARALAVFKDAIQVEPKTIEGELVRAQAIADAQYATYTDKTAYSDVGLAIRKVLNIASGDARLGDQLMPFVKTPANVVGAGIDVSGVLLPLQIYKLPVALKQAAEGDTAGLHKSIQLLVRAGLGLALAYLLSQLFKAEDFIGNYPITEKERKLLELKNATPNSVRINGKWISTDYFGPIAAPLVGMMYAKKYAHTPVEGIIKYYQGVVTQAQKIPGIKDFADLYASIQDFTNAAKIGSKELTTSVTNSVIDFVRGRVIPALVYDFAKAGDRFERVSDVKSDPLARIKASIPGLRETLPIKTDVFGNQIKSESALSTILFGSRVKTAADTAIVRELVRLEGEGQLPSITDVEKTSIRVQSLKEQISPAQYKRAMEYYHTALVNGITKTINTRSYQKQTAEDQKNAIEKVKNDALESMLKKWHYKAPKKK